MGNITDYIDITITRQTQGIQRAAMDVVLLLGNISKIFERTKEYNGIASIAEDFASTTEIYKMAQAVYAQNPAVKTIKVGRKYANVNAKQTLTPDHAPTAGTFTITLGTETTAAINYNADAAAIKVALEALTAVTTVTVTGTMATAVVIEFTGTDASKHWATMTVTESMTTTTAVVVTVQQYGSAVETYTAAIDAIRDYDDQWYYLLADTKTAADLEEIALAIQSMKKFFNCRTEDSGVPITGSADVASILMAANYTRSAIWYSAIADHKNDCAINSLMATKKPGSSTWMFKNLEGQTENSFTASQLSYLRAKNANFFHTVGGIGITERGKSCEGEWIDNIVGIDYMQARMEEDLFQALANADKIPYTNAGVAIIVSIIQARLHQSFLDGFIKDDYVVNYPDVDDIDDADKIDRLLPDITFSANLQSAIHSAQIRGTVAL